MTTHTRWPGLPALAALCSVAIGGCGDSTTGPDVITVISVPFDFSEDASAVDAFRLIGVNGSVVVIGRSTGETFSVSGFRRVQNCTESQAESYIDDLQVDVVVAAAEILVQTLQPVSTAPCSLLVDYELSVPERLFARIFNVNGSILVEDMDEGVDVTNVNGLVTLDDVEDDVTVRLTNGNILANAHISDDEAIDLLTVNGS
ncbi:MAG: hypothetical protein OEU54_11640, partial [Gemmatimonadota bacterium]|nr:hypothetical protein [Gemmatimonadota bacterium]